MFFLLYRQKDIDKVIAGNYRNYVIDKFTCEISMCNQMVTSEIRERLGKLLGFGQNASEIIP